MIFHTIIVIAINGNNKCTIIIARSSNKNTWLLLPNLAIINVLLLLPKTAIINCIITIARNGNNSSKDFDHYLLLLLAILCNVIIAIKGNIIYLIIIASFGVVLDCFVFCVPYKRAGALL